MAEQRQKRSDGARNRKAVTEAARTLFAAHGLNVPLELISLQAGVSRMTLFRHYADRNALILEIFEEDLVRLAAYAENIAAAEDGFLILLKVIAEGISRSQGLSDLLRAESSTHAALTAMRERVIHLMLTSLRVSQGAGYVRKDIDSRELSLILDALTGAMANAPVSERDHRAEAIVSLLQRGIGASDGRTESG